MDPRYDGNNYVQPDTPIMWWVGFLTVVVVLTMGLLCWYLYETYRACEVTKADYRPKFVSDEAAPALRPETPTVGADRPLAPAGTTPHPSAG